MTDEQRLAFAALLNQAFSANYEYKRALDKFNETRTGDMDHIFRLADTAEEATAALKKYAEGL